LINSRDDILDFHTIFVTNTYPIFTTNYRNEIKRVKNEISKFKNLTLFGRQGSFSYENADGLIKDALTHKLLQKA
jgi:UDP-galactopyranose mutase